MVDFITASAFVDAIVIKDDSAERELARAYCIKHKAEDIVEILGL